MCANIYVSILNLYICIKPLVCRCGPIILFGLELYTHRSTRDDVAYCRRHATQFYSQQSRVRTMWTVSSANNTHTHTIARVWCHRAPLIASLISLYSLKAPLFTYTLTVAILLASRPLSLMLIFYSARDSLHICAFDESPLALHLLRAPPKIILSLSLATAA